MRLTPADVQNGDLVVVPVNPWTKHKIQSKITLAMIAAKHGLTAQAIFDHVDNQAVNVSRGTVAGLQNGDEIFVSWSLLGDGVWLQGHDL